MPQPIRRLTVHQFIDLVEATSLQRRITAVHVHHTWRPRRRDFRGLPTIEAMRRYHVETQGWSDIAQHLTIDPTGHLWTGRDWEMPPASSAGRNGTRDAGPFMFEIIGDFDEGQDVLDGPQRDAVIDVTAALVRKWSLDGTAIFFHRDLGSPKSCPGTGVDRAALTAAVVARLTDLPQPAVGQPEGAPRLFGAEHVLRYAASGPPAIVVREDEEVPEHRAAAADIEGMVYEADVARQTLRLSDSLSDSDARGEDPSYRVLRSHVVNLSRGELSVSGLFRMTPDSLDAIVEGIRSYATASQAPHLVLYAHGGLVSERSALNYARGVKDWWLRHGVYPVFFVWESGIFEILGQYILGRRDVADWTSDLALELAAKIPGSAIWGGMKDSARRASALDAGNSYAGGARMFAELLAPALAALAAQGRAVTVHAIGHSAGAIFHSHLVPMLRGAGVGVDSLSFLAPAVRVDLFAEKLLPLVSPPGGAPAPVKRFFTYTMEEDAERSDHCWHVYRKSLLYFVSNSFEGIRRKPILGLHESIRKDDQLRTLFGIDDEGRPVAGANPRGTLYLSYARGKDPNLLTRSLEHGCFDNDRYTLSAVLRRVVGVGDDTGLGLDDFPFAPTEICGFDTSDVDAHDRAARNAVRGASVTPGWMRVASSGTTPPVRSGGGQKRALCVGINEYRDRPLGGCVADARAWGRELESLGFSVQYLFDQHATRERMMAELQALVGSGGPGDILVFEYSGHGSQVADEDGDEIDRYDEVFVPVDYHTGALLLDDDLADVLGGLQRGTLFTLFMDCCHSGTNSRFAPAERPLVTGDDRVRYLPLGADVEAAHRALRARMRSVRRSAEDKSLPGVIHFAACQDHEYAWESSGHGDFTTAATPLLGAAFARGETNERFLAAVREAVAARGRQHPMVMTPAPGMDGQPLLAPLTAVTGALPSLPAGTGRASDQELVAHLEAMIAILRGRTAHGA